MKKKVQLFSLKKVISRNGTLIVAQLKKKFDIKRVFTITTDKNILRGSHAHRYCSQILFCPYGKIEVEIFDGKNKKKIYLSKPSKAILIPTMIWSTQKFLIKNSVLVALCNKKFTEKDYIRDIKMYNKLTMTKKN
jgi:dTDP-4-dehydrorhamnose 3,5-epimerase-like enzyme